MTAIYPKTILSYIMYAENIHPRINTITCSFGDNDITQTCDPLKNSEYDTGFK